MGGYRFRKAERLGRQNLIAELFKKEQQDGSVKAYPFVVTWRFVSLNTRFPAQVIMVASKKGLPKAADRTRVKRQMRELYRYRKQELYALLSGYEQQITLALIFTGKELVPYEKLQPQFDKVFNRLLAVLAEQC